MDQPVQIVLAYEHQPCAIFEATTEVVIFAFDGVELPPEDCDNDTYLSWLREYHIRLRNHLRVVRDHAERMVVDNGRRIELIRDAVVLLSALALSRGTTLDSHTFAMLDYCGTHAASDSQTPGHIARFGQRRLSFEELQGNVLTVDETGVHSMESRPQPGRQCVSIAGYWNNQGKDGLCVTVHGETPGSLDQICELLRQMIESIARTHPSKDDMLDFLRRAAVSQDSEESADKMMVLATIAYMEENGLLEANEYNGMLYMYSTDTTVIQTVH